jgi:release factor glutamine methyltransferase
VTAAAASGRDRTWTVIELLRWTTGHFAGRGIESARLDAECLLAFALGCDRLRLYLEHDKPVSADERAAFRTLVRRRADERRPVAQLVGRREFFSLPLAVTPDVLVPRPETETLVETGLRLGGPAGAARRVLDVGTGSGAVALALAHERPAWRVTATDVCADALALARRNAEALGLAGRVELRAGDLFEAVAGERFDLVLSNPPYLADAEAGALAPELAHEPRAALFAGPRGTEVLRRLAEEAGGYLRPEGAAAFEIAPHQAGDVTQWMERAGLVDVRVQRDLAGRPRVVSGRRPAATEE